MTLSAPLAPVLLADDEPDDVFLLSHRLKKAGLTNRLEIFRDGAQLIAFLSDRVLPGGTLPRLLLLDLKMPFVDGFDALAWIRAQDALKPLRIAVVSSSQRPEDKERAAAAGADEYFEKFPTTEELAGALARAS